MKEISEDDANNYQNLLKSSKRIYDLQQRKAEECYLPGYWYLIMAFIKTIPETIFKRLRL